MDNHITKSLEYAYESIRTTNSSSAKVRFWLAPSAIMPRLTALGRELPIAHRTSNIRSQREAAGRE